MTDILTVAVEAAHAGGEVLVSLYQQPRAVDVKTSRADLVTDADRASEAAILSSVRRACPDARVLAEEGGASGSAEGLRWIIDPLDGTANYAAHIPHWCVSIGVEDAEGLVVGVVYDPLREETFAALRGEGGTLNGRPLEVRDVGALEQALLATGFSYEHSQRADHLAGVQAMVLEARGIRRMGSAALDLAYVACGRMDGFWERGLRPWDLAAGIVLVREAGGEVSPLEPGTDPLQTGAVVAAGPALHRVLAPRLREIESSEDPGQREQVRAL